MESLKKQIRDDGRSIYVLVFTMIKWFIISAILGIVIGSIASGFAYAVTFVTELRTANPWIVFGLPFGGLAIIFLYTKAGQADNTGTNLVLTAVRSDKDLMPGRVAPLILIATCITHLFGGSSGREGAALQFGASIGAWMGRLVKMNKSDKRIMLLAGMSAAFAALFGTPMAAAVFSIEMVSVGVIYYTALAPCVFAAFIAQRVSVYFQVRTFAVPYFVGTAPSLFGFSWVKVILMASIFAAAGAVFCVALHRTEHLYKHFIKNPYLRVFAGGLIVIVLYLLVGNDNYLGLGGDIIAGSFTETRPIYVFILKIVFTCATLCAGFKGGEIVPSLFIGSTLGSAVSVLFGLPVDLCAACGMAGVFVSVTNSPITALLIAFELFGAAGMPYYSITIAVCYLLSGYQSLYGAQHFLYSKTEHTFYDGHMQ